VFDKPIHITTPWYTIIKCLEIYRVLSPEDLGGEERGEWQGELRTFIDLREFIEWKTY
jgi:hypothetical protein